MNVEAITWSSRLRAVPWAVWVLLLLGVGVCVSANYPALSPLGTINVAGPIVFAAAVVFVAPPDRRFRWAALGMAALLIVLTAARWIPEAWQAVAPGDWVNATPLLLGLGDIAVDLARVLGLVGLALFGLALGGVRSFTPALIVGFGVALGLANLIWIGAQSIEGFPLFDLVKSVAFSVLNPILWAFVFAAAVESLRSLTLIGTGLIVAGVATGPILLWWAPGPGTNTDLLAIVTGGLPALGWLAVIAGALRGELNGTPGRGRPSRARARR